MTGVVWAFALLAAVVHVLVFVAEAFLIERPAVHQGIFLIPTSDVPAIRLWAFGVGFYNLSLALGMVAGVVSWASGHETVGRTLIVYISLFMLFGGALVLLVADRLAMGRPRGKGIGGVLGQGIPPLAALIALAL